RSSRRSEAAASDGAACYHPPIFMMRAIGIGLGALLALAGLTAAMGAAPAAPVRSKVRLQTDVSYTANLVHWVDNLAGTSVGKTLPIYRSTWLQRFGPPDDQDKEALSNFARIRRLPVASNGSVVNLSGCLPVESDTMSWHQRFLAAAMEATS